MESNSAPCFDDDLEVVTLFSKFFLIKARDPDCDFKVVQSHVKVSARATRGDCKTLVFRDISVEASDFRPALKRMLLICLLSPSALSRGTDYGGAYFVGFSEFSKFAHESNVVTSPHISAPIDWNELIASWNVRGNGKALFEARVVFPDATTPFYRFAVWSSREHYSITNQTDQFGTVALDTLMMKRPGGKVQVRVTLTDGSPGDLKFLALSFAETGASHGALPSNRGAWGKKLSVRIESQLDFPNNEKLCSPTGYSMILDFWARQLHRRELSLTAPEIARRAYDPSWQTPGNWAFNTAVGGHFEGIRSYVTRLSDISELEDWIEAGIPVAASISFSRLEDETKTGKGHLVVCIGFEKNGDVIVNDPGTRREWSRRTLLRERFRAAWADSNNTVYLTYPEGAKIPTAKHGHWE